MPKAAELAHVRRRIVHRDGPTTHFAVEGCSVVEGLALIEATYPGISQPGDTADGVLRRRRVLLGAHRHGRDGVAWRVLLNNATPEQLEAARGRARDVLTIAPPPTPAPDTSIEGAGGTAPRDAAPRALGSSRKGVARVRLAKRRATGA